MKFSHLVFRVLTPVLLLAMPLGVAAQQAESASPARPQRPGGNPQLGAQGFALGGPVGVLTDEQRASYMAAMNRQRARMIELQAQLRVAQENFVAASVEQKFDENAMREKAMAAYRIDAEIAVLKAKAMSEVQPPLTAEQIEKIKTGQAGPMRPLRPRQQLQNPSAHAPAANTNQDVNGLPPKK